MVDLTFQYQARWASAARTARAGGEAREDDGMGDAAGAHDDDVETLERPAQRQLHAGAKPRRIGVDADELAVVRADDVVHRADGLGVGLDRVAQPRDQALVR